MERSGGRGREKDIAGAASWRASDSDVLAICESRHGDAFSILGPHPVPGGAVVRAFIPQAGQVSVETGGAEHPLERRTWDGFFEGQVPGLEMGAPYRLKAQNEGGPPWSFDDPYRFAASLGSTDDYLLVEGSHRRLYERLGAHPVYHQHTGGVRFSVWAPDAQVVSLVGEFNEWDGRRHPMRKRVDSGIWELFMPELTEGVTYKFEIRGPAGNLMPLKADPFGFAAELRPSTASKVARTDTLSWSDQAHMRDRASMNYRRAPVSIYEVHLGSWRRGLDGAFLSYDDFADQLVSYAVDMGFTHLELMPVNEHPLDDSWGYQPVGLFAPTSRFGDPAGFARLVDRAHRAGLGVLLDWTPAHFPIDSHGLAEFDGKALYEHADPRRGFHPQWTTAIYDYGRREVCNFLYANALYWLDRFHIDGLRVDAVASMLYLDYAREAGEWLPNQHGGNQNLEAVGFLQELNRLAHEQAPGVMMVAEESTAWPGVSAPTYAGGLGFGFKWNMGWMNDTLRYMAREPVHRKFHQNELTFGPLYAFSENFVLPISHDEVVHGKGSMIGKMPGDDWQKFAGLRAYYGFMWGHPGKKLLFQGCEFAQRNEWNFRQSLDWHLLDYPLHLGMQKTVRDLNRLYRSTGALHARDCEGEGFQWIVADDAANSVLAWMRYGEYGDAPVAVICNLTPVPRPGYRIGLPMGGVWAEVFNSDSTDYGGSGQGNLGHVIALDESAHGFSHSVDITLPPMATIMLRQGG